MTPPAVQRTKSLGKSESADEQNSLKPKRILPPEPDASVGSSDDSTDKSSSPMQLKPKSRTSMKRLSLRSKKRGSDDIERSVEEPDNSESKESSPALSFQQETEKLLDMLSELDLLSLPNGEEIDEQVTKMKLHLLRNKKAATGSRSRAETITKQIIGKFTPTRSGTTPVANEDKPVALSVPKRPSRPSKEASENGENEEQTKTKEMSLLSGSAPSSAKSTPKSKSRRSNRQQIASTFGTIGKFIDETAAIAVAPLTSSGAEELPPKVFTLLLFIYTGDSQIRRKRWVCLFC